MIDVLIVYENKSREIENACLLASELEYRGYKVSIRNVLSLRRYFTKAKVVIAPHLYNNFQIDAIAKNFWCTNKRIIDLQYEQVLGAQENGDNDIHDPKEDAIHAQHIAWGPCQLNRYISHGIDSNNVHLTGHIAMDLLSDDFDSYFYSKEELSREFELDSKKKWILFISSFSYANRTEADIIALEKLDPNAREMCKVSNLSKQSIVSWLKRYAEENSDIVVIYRKHPAESNDSELALLQKQLSNFVCIDKYSVRQWVKSCDHIFTWLSTSIVDAYYSHKDCQILRPVYVPPYLESAIMENAVFLGTYEEFCLSIINPSKKFPIDENIIKYYYGNNGSQKAYISICDLVENMIHSEEYSFDYNYGHKGFDILNSKSTKTNLKVFVRRVLFDICTKIHLSRTAIAKANPKIRKVLEHYENEGFLIADTITDYKKRFYPIINDIHKS